MNKSTTSPEPFDFVSHDLVGNELRAGLTDRILYEKRPAKAPDGSAVDGLYNAWITLNNPAQFNAYTTDMVKGMILALRAASNARDVVAVVVTGAGTRRSAPVAIPRNMPNTTPAGPRNTASTCGFSTTWSARS